MTLPARTHSATGLARLEIRNLHKSLGGVRVVDGVDLEINEGESVVLLGPSGCGKTTTLRMVAGFIEPDGGEILLAGRVASGGGVFVPTEKRHLGMVFQSYAVWPHRTVFDNVAFGLITAGMAKAAVRQKVGQVLELVQLSGFERRFPGDLSGGQQQRVALARSIVVEPSLLLLDEPLSNLDAGLRQEMRSELKKLHRRANMTTLYVTHDQDEALVLADRIAVMNQGRIEQLGSPEDIYRRPNSRFAATFVGTTNFLEGRVEDIDAGNGRALVRTPLGEPFWTEAPAGLVRELHPGSGMGVSIRPESIRTGKPGSGQFTAVVEDISFLGNRYDLQLRVNGQELLVHAASREAVNDGRVDVSFDPSGAWGVREDRSQ